LRGEGSVWPGEQFLDLAWKGAAIFRNQNVSIAVIDSYDTHA